MSQSPPENPTTSSLSRFTGIPGEHAGPAIAFFVAGTAKPKGSHRAFVVRGRAVLAGASTGERAWRDRVTDKARDAMQGMAPLTGPVSMLLEFYSLRPKGHYRKSGQLRPGVQPRPTAKPDFDKLARSVADALTGVCYRDDALVCEAYIRKRYANERQPYCGVWVVVKAFEGEP